MPDPTSPRSADDVGVPTRKGPVMPHTPPSASTSRAGRSTPPRSAVALALLAVLACVATACGAFSVLTPSAMTVGAFGGVTGGGALPGDWDKDVSDWSSNQQGGQFGDIGGYDFATGLITSGIGGIFSSGGSGNFWLTTSTRTCSSPPSWSWCWR